MRSFFLGILVAGCGGPGWDPAHPTKGGPPPPTDLSPNSGEPGPRRPTLSWHLPSGEDGALVVLCKDPKCRKAEQRLEVTGSTVALTADLAPGTWYWRAYGRAGKLFGTHSSDVAIISTDEKVGLGGTHIDVILPAQERPLGEKLVHLGDEAMLFFSAELGLPPPESKSRVYFYVHMDQLRQVLLQWARAERDHPNEGFTLPNTGSHILLDPDESEASVMMLHELAHAFQQKQVKLYWEQPTWLREGVCDHLAGRMMAPGRGDSLVESPILARRVRTIRKALAAGKLLPLAKIFDADHSATRADAENPGLLYAQAFSVVHWLDSPENPERQKKFRAFLRDISTMTGFLGGSRIESRFHKDFGDTATIEREWLAWLRANEAPKP